MILRPLFRTFTSKIRLLGFVAIAVATNLGSVAVAQDDPVVTEYDVDPNWPQRPDNVSGTGWVSGLAIDKDDNIWFFRKGADPVQCYTAEGKFVRTWGRDQFVNPHHLRIDGDGNVWVADFGQHIVQKFTPEGELLMTLGVKGEAGTDDKHFNMPTDMAFAANGDIFVSDGYGNRRIVHFNKAGKFIKTFGEAGTKPGQFVIPHAIVIDSKDTIYVADRNSGRIQIFDQSGELLDVWSNILMPWGLSITKDDDLWVCGSSPHWWFRHDVYPEYKDQLFMKLTSAGRPLQMWTLPLGDIGTNKDMPDTSMLKPGETVGAHCIGEDSKGNIYIGDIYGERCQKFVPISKRN